MLDEKVKLLFIVIVLDPKLIVRVLEPEELRLPNVTLKLAVLKVPAVTVSVFVATRVSESASVTVMPEPFIMRLEFKLTPDVVMVPVPETVTVPL